MKDFRFLDYYTEYSCTGTFEREMDVAACFGYVFNKVIDETVTEEYEIILYKGTEFSKKRHNSNACLFTENQIKNHLKQAQTIYPFKFRIEEIKNWDDGFDVFKVYLKLSNVPGTFHEYILTWLRYMYEYPYNVILYDAYKLKKDSCFRFTSISDLFNLVLSCFNENPREIHQIALNQINKTMRKKEIREKLQKVDQLNNIYKKLEEKVKNKQIPDKIDKLSTVDIEYWESDDIFENWRKPIYMDVYKQIIKKK